MTDNSKIVEDILGEFGWETPEYDVTEEEDKHFYIIGLDPGVTTGVAILRIDTEDKKAVPELIFLDQVPDAQYGFYDYFARFYVNPLNTVVASEWWVEHNKRGADRTPIRVEGVIHALWDDRNVAKQPASEKVRVTDEFLKESGLWTPGKPHQMDALRHAIIWLLDQQHEGMAGAMSGDGEPMEGDGEGVQGDGTPLSEEAKQELAELARQMLEERGNPTEIAEDGEPQGDGGDMTVALGKTKDPEGKRKQRELNDAFIGFQSAEAEAGENERSLLDD
jgi:hypothetical protein